MRSFILVAGLALGACAATPWNRPLTSMSYRQDGRLVMVEARINGAAPAWFMVDSGASHTVIDPRLQRQIGLPIVASGATTGTGAGSVGVGHAGPVRMTLGTLELDVADPWVIDLAGVPIDPETRGLVGAELFKSHIVRIDPLRRRFEVFNPARFTHSRGGAFIPLTVDGDKLLVSVTLDVRPGLTVTELVRIDTGAEGTVNHPIAAQAEVRVQSSQGNGLGANFEAYSGRYRSVRIGPHVIRDVWGPGAPGPTLGMEILRRFVVTFDAPHGRLHLLPTDALGDPVPAPG
jgi:predicted aspartyl protease